MAGKLLRWALKMDNNFFYTDNRFRYVIVPPVFLIFFTNIVQFLTITGQGQQFEVSQAISNLLGNYVAWEFAIVLIIWGYLSLVLSSREIYGPTTPGGYKPKYKDNGFLYFWLTMAVFLAKQIFYPNYKTVYLNMPQILGVLNTLALVLCSVLVIKGKMYPENQRDILEPKPILYEFYRGVELHPRLFSVDVKQLTNCRVGMMSWQIFITCYFLTGLEYNGFNMAAFVNWFLQTVYIAKFFWWESGYFYTLDMMLDRAGYYICWGCLVWVPCLYTYSSYYIVAHPPTINTLAAVFLLLLGLTSVFLNYVVDLEKQTFRNSPDFDCYLWGQPARYIRAKYKDAQGVEKETALLVSGFWGFARHLNYTFELLGALSWCSCGLTCSLMPFLYFVFLFGLLLHRTIRDEQKCEDKYGGYWKEYCKQVPYRWIPYVW